MKARLLLLCGLLLLPTLASAQVAHIGTFSKGCTGVTSTCTSAAQATTAGHALLFTFVGNRGDLFTSVSDSASETWTEVTNPTCSPKTITTTNQIRMFYALNCHCSATQTFTVNATGGDVSFFISEFSHIATVGAFDQCAGVAQASTNAPSSGVTGTRTKAAELLYAAFGAGEVSLTSVTAGAGFTVPTGGSILTGGTANAGAVEYQVVSVTGTTAGTFSTGATTAVATIIATFKDDSSSATSNLTLLHSAQ